MSLRKAIESLPDDRATVMATRQVVAFFETHPNEWTDSSRVARATNLEETQISAVLRAMADAFVLDCGDSNGTACRFTPDVLLAIEVRRYLRASAVSGARLQRDVDRFRGRFGGIGRQR